MILLFLCLTCMLVACSVSEQSSEPNSGEPIVLSAHSDHLKISAQSKILEDQEGKLGIEDVTSPPWSWDFLPIEVDAPNIGYSSSVYWVKMNLLNADATRNWLLELAAPILDEVVLYEPVAGGGFKETKVMHIQPMEERSYFHWNYVLPLELPDEGGAEILLRISTEGPLQIPLHLWEEKAFEQRTRGVTAILGLLTGAALIFVGYLLYRGLYLKQRKYLYLAGLNVSILITLASLSGLTFAYIWRPFPIWNNYSVMFFIGVSSVLLLAYTSHALNFWKTIPWLSTLFRWLVAIQVLFLIYLQISYDVARYLLPWSLLAVSFSTLAATLYSARKTGKRLHFYTAAQLMLFSGTAGYALIILGYLPYLNVLRYSAIILMIAGIILFMLALQSEERMENQQTSKRILEEKGQQDEMLVSLREAIRQKDELLELISGEISEPLTLALEDGGVGAMKADEPLIRNLNLSILPQDSMAGRGALNLLVAGSEGLNRQALMEQLDTASYKVGAASNSAEISIRLAKQPVDLLIIESGLSDLDTVELCSRIRVKYSMTELPILLLSENDDLESKKAAFTAGANDYLVTPCEKEEFLLRVSILSRLSGLTTEIVNMNQFLEKNLQEQAEALEISNHTLTTLTDEIKEIEQIRNEMLSVISHELNTPITLIHQYIQAVQENLIEERNPQYLSMIHNKLMLLERLTEDLVDLAKYRSGNITLKFEQLDAAQWLQYLLESFLQDAEKSGRKAALNTQIDWEPLQQYDLIADSDRLDQVFSNILLNAVKHTPAGDQAIFLSNSMQESSAEAFLIVQVEDAGDGIDPEVLPFIFDRFYKFEKNTAKKGSGLGLAIAKEIVEAHKGRIWAESELNKGSVFHVALPLVKKI